MKAKVTLTGDRERFGDQEWVALAAWSIAEGWDPFRTAATVIPAPEVRKEDIKILSREIFSGREEITVELSDEKYEEIERWLDKLEKTGFWGPAYD